LTDKSETNFWNLLWVNNSKDFVTPERQDLLLVMLEGDVKSFCQSKCSQGGIARHVKKVMVEKGIG